MGVNEKVSDFVHQGIKLIFSNLKWIMATFGYVLLNKIVISPKKTMAAN